MELEDYNIDEQEGYSTPQDELRNPTKKLNRLGILVAAGILIASSALISGCVPDGHYHRGRIYRPIPLFCPPTRRHSHPHRYYPPTRRHSSSPRYHPPTRRPSSSPRYHPPTRRHSSSHRRRR